ncbi:MAG: hypothetical protein HYY30_03275 [Chloroflexi bacterium]|nr:hypothetical protein [Chloroflexota bacterium]
MKQLCDGDSRSIRFCNPAYITRMEQFLHDSVHVGTGGARHTPPAVSDASLVGWPSLRATRKG